MQIIAIIDKDGSPTRRSKYNLATKKLQFEDTAQTTWSMLPRSWTGRYYRARFIISCHHFRPRYAHIYFEVRMLLRKGGYDGVPTIKKLLLGEQNLHDEDAMVEYWKMMVAVEEMGFDYRVNVQGFD